MEWINVSEKDPEGICLVWIEKPSLGTNICVGNFTGNVHLIGGRFAFDMPEPLFWMPLPQPPENIC